MIYLSSTLIKNIQNIGINKNKTLLQALICKIEPFIFFDIYTKIPQKTPNVKWKILYRFGSFFSIASIMLFCRLMLLYKPPHKGFLDCCHCFYFFNHNISDTAKIELDFYGHASSAYHLNNNILRALIGLLSFMRISKAPAPLPSRSC